MAKTYRMDGTQRVINGIYRWLTDRGLGAEFRQILTVRGRRSGEPRSLPVDVLEVDGSSWLVSPYGLVNWVHNVRAAETLTLRRAGAETSWRASEVTGAEAVPVIRAYLHAVPVTHPYWDVTEASSDAELTAALPKHPVFRLTPEP
ncbi:nitroreductase family deazaflavin-dependent oxidoreductase [Microlunatus speluncae]|uniref:nitroreductase family deazaflavin-dependent oxidoreductase n=1 Tax=Microlunatus speluncae TaxID=2594267 RepID=UPI0012666475|nr:nitroreductase family deazaflavin-dependent oxidoreductase [Microlunatus speluncae]